jgi:hypothetical protein
MPSVEERLSTGFEETSESFLIRELPYLLIFALTAAGAGYVSMMSTPIVHYWDAVAVFIGVVCVLVGWRHFPDRKARWRLVWTQVLHWGAFLIAMNMVFLPSMEAISNADANGVVVLFLLALGTFVAGVHSGSVRLCLNGAVMALLVPAIAWLDESALFLTLIMLVIVAAGAAFLWHRHGRARV